MTLSVLILNALMLYVVKLRVIMLNVSMPNVVMLIVMAPSKFVPRQYRHSKIDSRLALKKLGHYKNAPARLHEGSVYTGSFQLCSHTQHSNTQRNDNQH